MRTTDGRTSSGRRIGIAALCGFCGSVLAASAYLLFGGRYFLFVPRWALIVFFPGFWAGPWAHTHLGLSIDAGVVVGVVTLGCFYAALAGLACVAWRACFPNKTLATMNLLLAALCRWTARIVGAALVFLIAIVTLDDGIPVPAIRPLTWDGLIALALILMILGVLIGWRWELAGGILSLVGLCLGAVPLHNSSEGLSGFYFSLGLPGLLYASSALLRRRERKAGSSGGSSAPHESSETNLNGHEI